MTTIELTKKGFVVTTDMRVGEYKIIPEGLILVHHAGYYRAEFKPNVDKMHSVGWSKGNEDFPYLGVYKDCGEECYKFQEKTGYEEVKFILPEMEEIWCKNYGEKAKKVKLFKDSDLDINFKWQHRIEMDGVVTLDSGDFLLKKYGKYEPDLCFISKIPTLEWEEIKSKDLNLATGDFKVIYGDFFVSKKGTNCFRVLDKDKAKHMLIGDHWGGPFNNYQGNTLDEDKSLYYRRKRSNGGGAGVDYSVLLKDWKNSVSEDDI